MNKDTRRGLAQLQGVFQDREYQLSGQVRGQVPVDHASRTGIAPRSQVALASAQQRQIGDIAYPDLISVSSCKLLTGKKCPMAITPANAIYGLNGQVVATGDGVSVKFLIHAESKSKQAKQHGLSLELSAGSILNTDANYNELVVKKH